MDKKMNGDIKCVSFSIITISHCQAFVLGELAFPRFQTELMQKYAFITFFGRCIFGQFQIYKICFSLNVLAFGFLAECHE